MIGRPSCNAPTCVNVWYAHDYFNRIRFDDIIPKMVNSDMSVVKTDENQGLDKVPVFKPICRGKITEFNNVIYDKSTNIASKSTSEHGNTNKHMNKVQRRKKKKTEKKGGNQEGYFLNSEQPHLRGSSSAKGQQNCAIVSARDALQILEDRKKSIKAKLLIRKENLLTQEEEQDIHTRADLYAMTAVPEPRYFIVPAGGHNPSLMIEHFHEDCFCPPVQKKRRRNYGNTNCYVTYHNNDDKHDNTKMLPIGTKLLKPPTKLVELVAQAISGSPDGLLQVQQIYTFLQNKYPFFRYMDRVAINSWRSSVRHALYQKWFRKIRFDCSFISCKGCYWAINNRSSPKEWSLPDKYHDLVENQEFLDGLQLLDEEQETREVAAIARRLLDADSGEPELDGSVCDVQSPCRTQPHVPSPVKEPDPILATCTAPTWNNDDIYLSSAESGHGTMTPENSPQTSFLSQDDAAFKPQLFSTRVNHTESSKIERASSPTTSTEQRATPSSCRAEISPMLHWTPNWEEYGSYIISPQNLATQKYVLGLPGNRYTDTNNNFQKTDMDILEDEEKSMNSRSDCELWTVGLEGLNGLKSSCDSDHETCEYEIIAEFTKSEPNSPELCFQY